MNDQLAGFLLFIFANITIFSFGVWAIIQIIEDQIMTHNRDDTGITNVSPTDYGILFIIGFIALCVLL